MTLSAQWPFPRVPTALTAIVLATSGCGFGTVGVIASTDSSSSASPIPSAPEQLSGVGFSTPFEVRAVQPAFGWADGGNFLDLVGGNFLELPSVSMTWRDTSTNETGFRVERSSEGPSGLVTALFELPANSAGFSDVVSPFMLYAYRVQAFNSAGFSAFSNELLVAAGPPASLTVLFGADPLLAYTLIDPTRIRVQAPPSPLPPPHSINVVIRNSRGVSTDLLLDGYTWLTYPPAFPVDDLRLDADPAGSRDSTDPRCCCDGRSVCVVWRDLRDSPDGDIYANRSLDGGLSWLPLDVRLSPVPAGSARADQPDVAGTFPWVYAVWADARAGVSRIRMRRSMDGGETWSWSPHLQLDDGSQPCHRPRIACSGSNVYAVWEQDAPGGTDIYFSRSANNGFGWRVPVRLDRDFPARGGSFNPRICTAGDGVFVVWEDDRRSPGSGAPAMAPFDVMFNRSLDGGATWLATDVQLNRNAIPTATSPRIDCKGQEVYVVWEDLRSAEGFDVFLQYSSDAGSSFQPVDVRVNTNAPGPSDATQPALRCADRAYVTWVDTRNSAGGDVFFTSALGASVASDVQLDADPGLGIANPRVASTGGTVFVAWEVLNPSGRELFLDVSRDSGQTWLGQDQRVDHGVGAEACQVCADGARVYLFWQDVRDGAADIRGAVNSR